MASLKDGFQITLQDFKKRLTEKEVEEFQFVTLEDVRLEMARIQTEQEHRKGMMNMTRIQSFLEAMDQFGKVIEVFLNSSEFVPFVWGPVKFIFQIASTWTDSFEILLDAYCQIGQEIPLLEQYRALFEDSPHMRIVLNLIYEDILAFHKRAIRFFRYKGWRQLFRSVWKDFNTKFKSILKGLHDHSELVYRQANLLHVQQYQRDRTMMLQHLGKLEETNRQERYMSILKWISAAPTKLDHESACETRRAYPGTARWILQNSDLRNWKEADTPLSSILWLHGIPGAGKTILTSVIIEACQLDKSFPTSYFYCKYGDQEKNTCNSVLKGLLSQLICQSRSLDSLQWHDLVSFCHDRCLSSGELTLSSTSLIKQLFEMYCKEIPRQCIIIDGLDECEFMEWKSLLSILDSLVEEFDRRDPGKLRILFISQNDPKMEKAFTAAISIKLKATDNESDIRLFVKMSMVEIQRKFELRDDQVETISQTTCQRADGMILFAKLVMLNLAAQITKEKLHEESKASRIPKGLGEAYERILDRILDQNPNRGERKIAKMLLGWMVCASRPLKWREIQGAVSIEPQGQTVDFDHRRLRVHIRDLCGSLIQVLPGDRVELVHHTAKFYITDTGHVSTAIVESNITSLCLQYLTFECFEEYVSHEKLVDFAMKGYFAFQDYATANWSHHFHALVGSGQDLLTAGSDGPEAIQELERALDEFTQNYEEEICEGEALESAGLACDAFRQSDYFTALQLVWSHIYRHQEKGFEARNEISLKTLKQAIARNRKLLIELSHSDRCWSSQNRVLESFYGRKMFKCPKLTCYNFHEGFEDMKDLEQHINRHDRPFRCPVPDCFNSGFGFSSPKDLEKHTKSFHPDTSNPDDSFAAANPKSPEGGKFKCALCERRFTRGFALRNHVRTHTGDRPYACAKCGKAFTRHNDCKRHEKIHRRR